MLMYLIGKKHAKQLGNSGQKQICVECHFILCFPSCKTERILDVVDGSFNGCLDLIGLVPFWSSP